MEGIFKVLERTLSLVVTIQKSCDNQREQLELVCHECKSFLKKWDAARKNQSSLLQEDHGNSDEKEYKHSKEAEDIELAMNMLEKAKKVKERYLQRSKERNYPTVSLEGCDQNANESKTFILANKTEVNCKNEFQNIRLTENAKENLLAEPLKKSTLRKSISLENHCRTIPSLKSLSIQKKCKAQNVLSHRTVKSAPSHTAREKLSASQPHAQRTSRRDAYEKTSRRAQSVGFSRTGFDCLNELQLDTHFNPSDCLSIRGDCEVSLLMQKGSGPNRIVKNHSIFRNLKHDAKPETANFVPLDNIQHFGISLEMFEKMKKAAGRNSYLLEKARVLTSGRNKHASNFLVKLNAYNMVDANVNMDLNQYNYRHRVKDDLNGLVLEGSQSDSRQCKSSDEIHQPYKDYSSWIWYPSPKLSDILSQIPEVLHYENVKELQDLYSLTHEMQETQLWLDIVKILKETLPYLQNLNTHNRNFAVIYRILYSILCEEAQKFPVLIQNL